MRFFKADEAEEIAREQVLQKTYQTIGLPEPVKHNPWEE